jgi:hypothetical protein
LSDFFYPIDSIDLLSQHFQPLLFSLCSVCLSVIRYVSTFSLLFVILCVFLFLYMLVRLSFFFLCYLFLFVFNFLIKLCLSKSVQLFSIYIFFVIQSVPFFVCIVYWSFSFKVLTLFRCLCESLFPSLLCQSASLLFCPNFINPLFWFINSFSLSVCSVLILAVCHCNFFLSISTNNTPFFADCLSLYLSLCRSILFFHLKFLSIYLCLFLLLLVPAYCTSKILFFKFFKLNWKHFFSFVIFQLYFKILI